eukprot:8426604-Pyramimonas_sp.AAC.1
MAVLTGRFVAAGLVDLAKALDLARPSQLCEEKKHRANSPRTLWMLFRPRSRRPLSGAVQTRQRPLACRVRACRVLVRILTGCDILTRQCRFSSERLLLWMVVPWFYQG